MLGFRKISRFNEALLTKQVQRIMINKYTIIHRFLNAKYFPNNSIFKAKKKPRDNYLWKSIIQNKNTLLKGCWRICNGKSTNVLEAPWLHY